MARFWESWQPALGLRVRHSAESLHRALARLRLAWNVLRGRPTLYRAHIRGTLVAASHLRGAQLLIEPPPGGPAIEVTGVHHIALADVTVHVSDSAVRF